MIPYGQSCRTTWRALCSIWLDICLMIYGLLSYYKILGLDISIQKKKQGVLQGSILSPLIYAVFIDSLPKMLRINMITRCHNPLKLRSTLQAGTIKHLLKNGAIKVVLMAVQITIVLISTQQLYHPYYMQMMWFS